MFNNFFPKNRTVYETMWKIMVQPHRPQMEIRRMRFACWITKATDTHSQYVIIIAFPHETMVTPTCSDDTLHVCCLCS